MKPCVEGASRIWGTCTVPSATSDQAVGKITDRVAFRWQHRRRASPLPPPSHMDGGRGEGAGVSPHLRSHVEISDEATHLPHETLASHPPRAGRGELPARPRSARLGGRPSPSPLLGVGVQERTASWFSARPAASVVCVVSSVYPWLRVAESGHRGRLGGTVRCLFGTLRVTSVGRWETSGGVSP